MSKGSDKLRQENGRLKQQLAAALQRVKHLERVDAERQATLTAMHEQVVVLNEQMALLKKALFSSRRERFVPSPDQKLLFDPSPFKDPQEDQATDEAEPEDPSGTSNRKKRRRRRKRFTFPDCLPVERVEYPLSPEELASRYGSDNWCVLRELVTRRLEYIPPKAFVLEEVRFVYGPQTKSQTDERLITSEKPPSINEKGVLGPSVIAYLAGSKFERHLPLYRLQEELRQASQMWFSRSVLSQTLVRAAGRLRPLWDLIRAEILHGFYVRADETTARVLRPGNGAAKQVYLWVYVGDADHPYQLFDYRLDRTRAGPREILGDFQGGLLSDGHSSYASLIKESDGRMVDLGCWAHARRKFDESCTVTSHPLAHDALAWIWQLYDIEDRLAEASPAARLEARQRESVPILDKLRDQLDEARPEVRPSSKLAEAIGYALNRWEAMTRFTTDPRYAIDNNAAERSIRPSVIGRKNYQFFGSDEGGQAACTWYTIIQSARSNAVSVMPYLNDVLTRVPRIVPEYLRRADDASPFASLSADQREQLATLLPDRWLQRHPQHRADDRRWELDEANRRRRQKRALRRTLVKV